MWAVLKALSVFYDILSFLIVARVILSWFIRDPYNRLYMILHQITEPLLAPCRRLLYRFQGNFGLDFSPVLALLLLTVIYRVLCSIIIEVGM